jgi:integrase
MKAIIRACGNSRDKALITTLAESGCRTSEVGLMKVKHVVFEPYGARITVNGKTRPEKNPDREQRTIFYRTG